MGDEAEVTALHKILQHYSQASKCSTEVTTSVALDPHVKDSPE